MKSIHNNKKDVGEASISRRLSRWCNQQQHRLADMLNRSTAHWTGFQKKLALALFCLTMGANSGIVLYQSLSGKATRKPLRPDAISTIYLQADSVSAYVAGRQRQLLKAKIDSLIRADSGRVQLERLRRAHPGLWDSLQTLIAE
ncbi:hypothetical protein [Niabella hibiscisoli]|uniref:hypothetical protein n=1 Tax=Niabella hibiscisoli TaxID=1825928 RepID=UPI001F0DF525|nr:hypothetical protein [Niabella hibiscisoli]MCH5717806.1 hypothetical protein [Niabella hibiscisoli]